MTRTLQKAISNCSRLKNLNNKMQSYDIWDKYKRNVKLLPKTKQDYFNNIDIKSVSDTKKFWKTIKPYFSKRVLIPLKYSYLKREGL